MFFLIVLASVGMALAGPIPVSPHKRKEEANEIKIELVEEKDKENPPSQCEEIKL